MTDMDRLERRLEKLERSHDTLVEASVARYNYHAGRLDVLGREVAGLSVAVDKGAKAEALGKQKVEFDKGLGRFGVVPSQSDCYSKEALEKIRDAVSNLDEMLLSGLHPVIYRFAAVHLDTLKAFIRERL